MSGMAPHTGQRDPEGLEPELLSLDESADPTKTNDFDKFMDRIVIDERQKQKVDRKDENNPQRRIAARYQDRPLNKTRWGSR